jgi:hypothetical protein
MQEKKMAEEKQDKQEGKKAEEVHIDDPFYLAVRCSKGEADAKLPQEAIFLQKMQELMFS